MLPGLCLCLVDIQGQHALDGRFVNLLHYRIEKGFVIRDDFIVKYLVQIRFWRTKCLVVQMVIGI